MEEDKKPSMNISGSKCGNQEDENPRYCRFGHAPPLDLAHITLCSISAFVWPSYAPDYDELIV